MQTLTKAPASLLDLIARDGGLQDLATLTPGQKADLFRKLGVVQQILGAGYGQKESIKATVARSLNISKQAINCWIKLFNDHGFRGLIDGRRAAAKGRALMPDVTAQWIKDLHLRTQRNDGGKEVWRQVIDQWNLWRRTGDPQWALPGFMTPPADGGKGWPDGFSYESIRRCKPTNWQAKLARQGTIASYRDLPSIRGTRVGVPYLGTIFFDDQKDDVQVRVLGFEKPMVPLSFNSIDYLTAYPFPPHIRLRWFDTEEKVNRSLTQKEFVWYVIFILCTEGYRTDEHGTRLVQEHGTAKTWSNQMLTTPDGYHSFEQALASLTGGKVTMDDSGLFNKPAFAELLYGPQSSGNPRFKAPVESFFHAVRTYSLGLIGQTGRNVEMAPEETYGIDKIERTWLRAAKTMPEHLREALQSNYLSGIEFGTLALLIRDALANRTDHEMEGWDKCNFVEMVWRWAADEPGLWRPRSALANLPQHLREMALHEQAQDHRLTDMHRWSPARAREACRQDPAITRLDFKDAIHLLPTEWAKNVKVRDRHEIHLTEDLLPGEELIYLPELTTPRGRTEFLQPGDELMVYLNPLMPDALLVCDMQFNFLGTLTRSIRIGRDNNQLEEMYKQRARLKTSQEAPVRRAMQPVADRRDAVATLNRDLIDRANGRIPAGSPEARSESARQGVRTAAANRLQAHGEAGDFSDYTPPVQPSAFDSLPDDEELPEAF
jgi:hypothetical protein